jgi:multidrug resistance efflux pump
MMAENNKPDQVAAGAAAATEAEAQPVDAYQEEGLDRFADKLKESDARSEVIEGIPQTYLRGALHVLGGAMLISLLIGWFGTIHVIVKGKGMLTPELENIFVEARETGVVKQVHVKPGEALVAGQLVLTMDKAQSGAELDLLQSELRLEEDKLRRYAVAREISMAVSKDPKSILRRDPAQFANAGSAAEPLTGLRRARQLLDRARDDMSKDYLARRAATDAQIALNVTSLQRMREAIAETKDSIGLREKDLEAKQQEFKYFETLAARRALPRSNVNAAREAVIQAESSLVAERQRIGQLELDIVRTELQSAELRSDLVRKKTEYETALETAEIGYDQALVGLNSMLAQLEQEQARNEARVSELRAKVELQNAQLKELQIFSPADGVLSELRYTTPGQFVERGARIGSFVPSRVKPIMVATVQNKDIAAVKPGTQARVKVDAYPFRQYGTVPAKVLSAFPVPEKPEFKVRLQLDRHTIKVRGQNVELTPGLTADVDILTQRTRLLRLIMKKLGADDDD